MLTLQNITLRAGKEQQALLQDVALRFPPGHFAAIVGPSGCGKSTLLKVIAGVCEPQHGAVRWQGRDLAVEDLAPPEIGYVPQFGIVSEHLTVGESVDYALRLRVRGLNRDRRANRINSLLQAVGLDDIADRRVHVLSGGQRRRLMLALEMVTLPALLLCDEATSGLDPKAEDEIVQLLHQLARERDRIVITVTHSLRHLALYDSIVVMYQGVVAYHGRPDQLLAHFHVTNPEEIYSLLATRTAPHWDSVWRKRRGDHGIVAPELPTVETRPGPVTASVIRSEPSRPKSAPEKVSMPWPHAAVVTTPNALTQCAVLWERRWRVFFRDQPQVWLHLALLLAFPCLVVVFAWRGLPQMHNLSMATDVSVLDQLRETNDFIKQSTKVGSLVSGLMMFQVILLCLMGSNNAAREIAAERLVFEKEKLAGLHPSSYLASKIGFLAVLVAAQSIWMGLFVNFVCRFPGDLLAQLALLVGVNAAMTSVCLAISSLLKSPEQASLVSVYLVGFQLPLSGAVLALPQVLAWITQPFIVAFWSWSGLVQSMRETRFYDAVQMVTQTNLAIVPLCFWVLGTHIVLGIVLAYFGCKRSQWD